MICRRQCCAVREFLRIGTSTDSSELYALYLAFGYERSSKRTDLSVNRRKQRGSSRIVQRRDGHLVSGAMADDDRARQVWLVRKPCSGVGSRSVGGGRGAWRHLKGKSRHDSPNALKRFLRSTDRRAWCGVVSGAWWSERSFGTPHDRATWYVVVFYTGLRVGAEGSGTS